MAQLKEGDGEALAELYRRYARKLYVFCKSVTFSTSPEDVVHDVFTRVIEAAGQFDHRRGAFRTWLFGIARNRCTDLVRRAGKVRFFTIEKTAGRDDDGKERALKDSLEDERVDTEHTVMRASVMEAVRDCIRALKDEEERQSLVMYYLGGKVFRDIGEILDKSTSMAKNYVEAAREKVKRCLEGKGIRQAV
jgi:RNA polymerase sigma-70 factor (ECF subfamily)